MKLIDTIIAWTPHTDEVAVGLHPDATGWASGYTIKEGACFAEHRQRSDAMRLAMLFIAFHTAVIRDGLNPHRVHEAFLVIDEYRRRIAPDIRGAEP